MQTAPGQSQRRVRLAALWIILLCAGLGIFVLPWHVAVKEESTSLSYTYGFNNTVAVLGVGVTLLALLVWLFAWGRKGAEAGVMRAIGETFALARDGEVDGRLWGACGVASVVFCAALGGWYAYAPFYRCGEMSYFINRLDLLLIGHLPYYGFPFYYGPGMLYPPYYLYKAGHGALSVEEAYAAVLMAHWAAGLFLLGYCVRRLFPAGRRLLAFWVFALILLNPTLGYNYTPFRYLLPVAGLLWMYSMGSRPERDLWAHGRVALGAFLCGLGTFEVSPEMGLATTLALVVYFAALLRGPGRGFAYGGVFAVLGAAAAVAPWGRGYIGVLFLFGGGNSLPVLPGLGILILLGAAFYLLPRFALLGLESREMKGAAALSFCVLSGLLLEPALSRCDLGHVFLNGCGLLLAGAAVCAHLPDARWHKGALWGLLLVFAVLGGWVFLFHYGYFFKEAKSARTWMATHPIAAAPAGHGFRFSKRYPAEDGLEPLAGYGVLETPLECTENVERFLLTHGDFDTPFNPGYNPDTLTVSETERRLGEIDGLQRIVVPKEALYPTAPRESDGERVAKDIRFLRFNMLCPVLKLTPRHPFYDADAAVNEKILRDFTVVAEVDGYLVMDRRSGLGTGAAGPVGR